ncbi:hypothetical protein VTK26DRAFT_3974 [Humicola hyalothermophila]
MNRLPSWGMNPFLVTSVNPFSMMAGCRSLAAAISGAIAHSFDYASAYCDARSPEMAALQRIRLQLEQLGYTVAFVAHSTSLSMAWQVSPVNAMTGSGQIKDQINNCMVVVDRFRGLLGWDPNSRLRFAVMGRSMTQNIEESLRGCVRRLQWAANSWVRSITWNRAAPFTPSPTPLSSVTSNHAASMAPGPTFLNSRAAVWNRSASFALGPTALSHGLVITPAQMTTDPATEKIRRDFKCAVWATTGMRSNITNPIAEDFRRRVHEKAVAVRGEGQQGC